MCVLWSGESYRAKNMVLVYVSFLKYVILDSRVLGDLMNMEFLTRD